MSDGSTDVLIVGGGPVGLSTALFLARKGIRPILVERRPRLSTIPRATGLHARTVEIFRTVGLEPAVQQAGMKIVGPGAELDLVRAGRATPLVMLGAQSLADLHKSFVMEAHDVDYDPFTPSWPIWCGQDHYEPLLHDAAVEAGAEIRFQNELIGLTQDQDGVTATVNDNGTTRTIRARYVVAADGVKSPVRNMLEIGDRSNGVAGNFVSIIFRAKVDLPESAPRFTLIYLMNQLAQGLLLFIEPGRWMFGVNYYPERGQSPADFTPERCVELARIAAGDPELEVEVESAQPWDARHMVADAYQSGRVFLAGDACHAHPPAGGFGVNAGIQDAHNLAWKLADVLAGRADESLLDSYEAERRPVGAATADQAWMLFRTRGQLRRRGQGRLPGLRHRDDGLPLHLQRDRRRSRRHRAAAPRADLHRPTRIACPARLGRPQRRSGLHDRRADRGLDVGHGPRRRHLARGGRGGLGGDRAPDQGADRRPRR